MSRTPKTANRNYYHDAQVILRIGKGVHGDQSISPENRESIGEICAVLGQKFIEIYNEKTFGKHAQGRIAEVFSEIEEDLEPVSIDINQNTQKSA